MTKKEKTVKPPSRYKNFWERNRQSSGLLLRSIIRQWSVALLRIVILFGLCFLILQPLLNKLALSFMEENDLYDPTIITIPRNFTTANYKLASTLMTFQKALINSVFSSLGVAICQVVACTIVGYGFARFKFRFKGFWFACVMLCIIVPPQTFMSSLYLNFRFFDIFGIFRLITGKPLNLLNSVAPYFILVSTCMGLKSGLYIFLLRQYFKGVPKELEEAAYVDGCGVFRTFVKIMIPDAVPMITSCFLFAYVWQWTDSLYSSFFFTKIKLLSATVRAIPDGLSQYLVRIYGQGTTATVAYSQMMTATGLLMFIAPLILIYLVAQKGFVESLSQTGIKM